MNASSLWNLDDLLANYSRFGISFTEAGRRLLAELHAIDLRSYRQSMLLGDSEVSNQVASVDQKCADLQRGFAEIKDQRTGL